VAGEIELLTTRVLTHITGNDAAGLVGRQEAVDYGPAIAALPEETTLLLTALFSFVQNEDEVAKIINLENLIAVIRKTITGYADYTVGLNYFLDQIFAPSNGSNINSGRTRCFPIRIQQPITIDRLGANISTGAAGGNIRLGIYNNNPTLRRPSSLVCATVNIPTDSSGPQTGTLVNSAGTAVTSTKINPGVYWGALRVDNTTVITTGYGANAIGSALLGVSPGTAMLGSSAVGARALDYTTGYVFSNNFVDLTSVSPDSDAFSNNNASLVGRAA
jgi:hypothetical protein